MSNEARLDFHRQQARAARPDWSFDKVEQYAAREVAYEESKVAFAEATKGMTLADLLSENDDNHTFADPNNPFGSGSFDGDPTDPWGLQTDAEGNPIDFDALLKERDSESAHRKAYEEYRSSEQYEVVEALRKGLADAGWSEERINGVEQARHKVTADRPKAAPKPKAPEAPVTTGDPLADGIARLEKVGDGIASLKRDMGLA